MQLFLQISGQVTEAFVQRCPIEIGVLKNVAKSTRKHLCQSLFFNKVRGLERERDRGRDRERDRETETQRHRERETERQRHRERDRDRERQRETETQRERDRERQTDRQTDRQTETERQRERERERVVETEKVHCMMNQVGFFLCERAYEILLIKLSYDDMNLSISI